MRQRRYEYDFFDRGDSCKLIVGIGRTAARIVLASGGRLWADSFPLSEVEVSENVIRIGKNVFAPDDLECDLTLGGMRFEAFTGIVPQDKLPTQWGTTNALGIVRYAFGAPVVGGLASGVFILDGTRWERPSVCVHTILGDASLSHTVVTGVGRNCALALAFGQNSTFGRTWTFARAALVTPEHTFFLGAPTRLTDCAEHVTDLCCTMRTPAVSLTVAAHGEQVSVDALGTTVCDRARAEITAVVLGTDRIRSFSCPAVWSRRGMRPAGEAERTANAVREPADD